LIGHGESKHAKFYGEKLSPSIDCYVDGLENEKLYRSYGLSEPGSFKEGVPADLFRSAFKTMRRGHMQGKTLGNASMIPGSFIVDRIGTIQWIHYNKHAGDHPTLESILEGAKKLSI
jgi:hypothetical protein